MNSLTRHKNKHAGITDHACQWCEFTHWDASRVCRHEQTEHKRLWEDRRQARSAKAAKSSKCKKATSANKPRARQTRSSLAKVEAAQRRETRAMRRVRAAPKASASPSPVVPTQQHLAPDVEFTLLASEALCPPSVSGLSPSPPIASSSTVLPMVAPSSELGYFQDVPFEYEVAVHGLGEQVVHADQNSRAQVEAAGVSQLPNATYDFYYPGLQTGLETGLGLDMSYPTHVQQAMPSPMNQFTPATFFPGYVSNFAEQAYIPLAQYPQYASAPGTPYTYSNSSSPASVDDLLIATPPELFSQDFPSFHPASQDASLLQFPGAPFPPAPLTGNELIDLSCDPNLLQWITNSELPALIFAQ
ncbi:hypothetical protein PUNSTDRAFT_130543 [Punctularia strigosozonata HHB-11173 SS5]|uniref:uncharacterized protein n=1 Tax=Punctularia strigosozonata (strain HHB-11173) TaxID=741275 RepID=UPI0004417E28|nr:uncharacterized protein PUNSTDRAFT_130543 [Punctularia strigosozonata HHB-11173 SS5]EIN12284.1 hypothetical protein PUNSTDRAFT_130543 [Punctularia strigosozonata HHB-11173 SS5]